MRLARFMVILQDVVLGFSGSEKALNKCNYIP